MFYGDREKKVMDMGDVPATSQTPDVEAGPRPQNMSEEVTLAMGLLSLTVRTQVPALSSLPTQSSCQVEWAETVAAVARRTVAYFMLDVDGIRCEKSEGYEGLYRFFFDQTPALPVFIPLQFSVSCAIRLFTRVI